MNNKLHILLLLWACLGMTAHAQTFDLTKPQPVYTDAQGYGYEGSMPADGKPFYFSVKVPDGNYRVTVTLGHAKRQAATVVRAENRRLLLDLTATRKKEFQQHTFVVNKRSPQIDEKRRVRLKTREWNYMNWDDRLTLEFNGSAPAVKTITIAPDTTATTIFLCGNSTVVDQDSEPWASWGQMLPCWFGPEIAVSNHAESGLTASSFLRQNRLDKVLSMLRPGDYVVCEFGHNDEKEHSAGDGAWYNYTYALKKYVDLVRAAGGHLVFVTPTQRRRWDDTQSQLLNTHGDYPAAMRTVAERERVPLIDLTTMTHTFFEALGYEGSTHALVHYPANTFVGQDQPLADNTHFNPYGAYEVSKMIVMGMKSLQLPITKHLRDNWKDYSPAQPDSWQQFVWFPAQRADTTKPDGN